MKTGQVSVEMLVIAGLAIAMLTPVLFAVFSRIADSETSLAISQADVAAEKLASAINSVAYSGSGASMVVEVKMPEGVRELQARGKELVLKIGEGDKETEIVKSLNAEVSSSDVRIGSAGTYRIRVKAESSGGQPKVRLSFA